MSNIVIFALQPFTPLPNCSNTTTIYDEKAKIDINCNGIVRKIISLRIYFALIIFNFLFVIITTSYFFYCASRANEPIPLTQLTANTTAEKSAENISRQWQSYSLKKRGSFGIALGAIGHLIFSTFVYLYQAFITSFACDIYLWGPLMGFFIWTYAIVWRTLRLHLLFNINKFQQQFKQHTKSDYTWFMRQKGIVNIGTRYHICFLAVPLCFIGVIVTLAETLGIRVEHEDRCDYSLGNHIILYAVVVFFVVVIPFIFWRLKGDADAHGIRREIWVTMGMGIPCFIIFVIWQTLFKPPTGSNPAASMRGIFGPSNWLVIVTTTYHIMTVVVPVFRKLTMTELSLPIRRQSISIIDSSSVGDQEELMMLELTTDSLESALRNPLMLKVLQTWAIKDFSVENILFYDRYLHLAQQLQEEEREIIPIELVPEVIDFYKTFITDQAPLQVNISHEARGKIDKLLFPLLSRTLVNNHASTSNNNISYLFLQKPVDYTTEVYDLISTTSKKVDYDFCIIESLKDQPPPVITLELFQLAKQEVFWNIFSGLFPKVVAAYDHTS